MLKHNDNIAFIDAIHTGYNGCGLRYLLFAHSYDIGSSTYDEILKRSEEELDYLVSKYQISDELLELFHNYLNFFISQKDKYYKETEEDPMCPFPGYVSELLIYYVFRRKIKEFKDIIKTMFSYTFDYN